MRQVRYFPAPFELAQHDTPENVWGTFYEHLVETWTLKQSVSTNEAKSLLLGVHKPNKESFNATDAKESSEITQIKRSCDTTNHTIMSHKYTYPLSNWRGSGFLLQFSQNSCYIRSSVCRTILIQRVLESTDPGASNGGSNFIF